jgi:hypothetical protein
MRTVASPRRCAWINACSALSPRRYSPTSSA